MIFLRFDLSFLSFLTEISSNSAFSLFFRFVYDNFFNNEFYKDF